MARRARIVVPGLPHHVTQRGSRRMTIFLSPSDYYVYLSILRRQARRLDLKIWVYCLMPNHVHLIAQPSCLSGLARPLGEAHRLYSQHINRREGWSGHLWQERFCSFPMDELHLLRAIRYVLLNPVRAGLGRRAQDWPYSSARSHLSGTLDPLITSQPLSERIEDWIGLLSLPQSPQTLTLVRKHSSTGRPLGSENFRKTIEAKETKQAVSSNG